MKPESFSKNHTKKYFLLIVVLLIIPVLLAGRCSTDSSIPEQIIGSYEAVEFFGIAEKDGSVDILVNGGNVTLQLHKNYHLEGEIKIPEDIGTSLPPINTMFSGTFNVSNEADTLWVENTETPLDYLSPFLISPTHLATIKQTKPNRGEQYIIFEKQ